MDVYEQVVSACQALQDKKAVDIVVLDVAKTSTITNYIVIATATSNTHARALLENVAESMSNLGVVPFHKEGYGQSDWVVLDFGDFIVHIFTQQLREYYNLEKLYQDGKNLRKFDSILKELMDKQKKEQKKSQQLAKQAQKVQDKKATKEKPAKEKTVKPKTAKEKVVKEKVAKPKTVKEPKAKKVSPAKPSKTAKTSKTKKAEAK